MWQDPEYALTRSHEEQHERIEKRKIAAEVNVKATKVQKAPTPAATVKAEEAKTLSGAQVTKIKAADEQIQKVQGVYDALMERLTPAVKEHVPQFQIGKAQLMVAKFAACKSQLELAVENNHGDFKSVMNEVGDVLKSAKAISDSLTMLVDEAEEHVISFMDE